jgi:hypothetical protein
LRRGGIGWITSCASCVMKDTLMQV